MALARNSLAIEQDLADDSARPAAAYALIGVLALLFLVTCLLAPMAGEDYGLSLPLREHATGHLLLKIAQRSALQITGWNARLGEQLAILWLGLPKTLFAVVNTLSFLVLTYVIAAFALRSVALSAKMARAWALALCATYLLWPRFEVFFWETGGAEYLQPLTCTCVVLLPFVVARARRPLLGGVVRYVVMLLLALLAGASFENAGPALLLYMTATLWLSARQGEVLRGRLGLMAAYAAGWAALLLAPSTKVRTAYYHEVLHIPPLSARYLVHRTLDVGRAFASADALLILCLLGLAAYLWWSRKRSPERTPDLDGRDLLLALAAAVSVCLVVAAPYTEPRAMELFWVILLAGIVRLGMQLRDSPSAWRLGAVSVAILALGSALYLMASYRVFAEKVTGRTNIILTSLGTSACTTGLPVSILHVRNGYRVLNSREDWVAGSLDLVSNYFGCKLVIVGGTGAPAPRSTAILGTDTPAR